LEKVTLFLLMILGGVTLGVVFVNPEGMKQKQASAAPLFEFRSYAYFDITADGVGEYLLADEGYHYDNRELLTGVSYYFRGENGVDTIRSHAAYIYNDHTDFNGSVSYDQTGGYKLESRDVRYNKKTSTIVGKRPFTLSTKEGEFAGQSFWVDTKAKVLKAERIKSWIVVDENTSLKGKH